MEDHAAKMDKASSEDHLRNRVYQRLKKNYRDSLKYLYDTGATYTQILKAAQMAKAEADNFKEAEMSRNVQPSSLRGATSFKKEKLRRFEINHQANFHERRPVEDRIQPKRRRIKTVMPLSDVVVLVTL